MSGEQSHFCEKVISNVSDVIEILDITNSCLDPVIDHWEPAAPLGRSASGVSRPLSHGLWFRGEQDHSALILPSAYKLFEEDNNIEAYDEKNAFYDLKLRMIDLDTTRYNSFEILCMMRHHAFPARIFDWSESPLTALYFAVSKPDNQPLDNTDGMLTCLNAYRLNQAACVTKNDNPGMFYPDSANVLIRSLMAEHTKLIDVFDRLDRVLKSNEGRYNKRVIRLSEELQSVQRNMENPDTQNDQYSGEHERILNRLRYPVAVVPKRSNLRMAAQQANFTIHGGKRVAAGYEGESDKALEDGNLASLNADSRIFSPVSLVELNDSLDEKEKFLINFRIDAASRPKIRGQLETLGFTNASLFPEFDDQARFVKNRWTKMQD